MFQALHQNLCRVCWRFNNGEVRFNMQHSRIVGGSTAKRVIACPGSVALVDKMPPKPSSKYADEGTLLHDAIAQVLESDVDPFTLVGTKLNDVELTADLIENKLLVA